MWEKIESSSVSLKLFFDLLIFYNFPEKFRKFLENSRNFIEKYSKLEKKKNKDSKLSTIY